MPAEVLALESGDVMKESLYRAQFYDFDEVDLASKNLLQSGEPFRKRLEALWAFLSATNTKIADGPPQPQV
jgi:hypothetical protein